MLSIMCRYVHGHLICQPSELRRDAETFSARCSYDALLYVSVHTMPYLITVTYVDDSSSSARNRG